MAAMTVEESSRKRKFGDGEPLRNRLTLGDRETSKANKLIEDLFGMVHAKEAEERDALKQKLLHSIAALKQTLDKPAHAVSMNSREKASYRAMREEIDHKIEASKGEVADAKVTLGDARAKRRRQEEYDALSAVALEVPSRPDSTAAIETLQADLVRLKAETNELDAKFELRKRQFQLLIHKVHDIRLILKGDGELGDVEEAADVALPDKGGDKSAAVPATAVAAEDRRPAMYGAAAPAAVPSEAGSVAEAAPAEARDAADSANGDGDAAESAKDDGAPMTLDAASAPAEDSPTQESAEGSAEATPTDAEAPQVEAATDDKSDAMEMT